MNHHSEDWARLRREQQEERRRKAEAAGRPPRDPEDPLDEEGTFNDEGTRG
jgi:hypothetical protein